MNPGAAPPLSSFSARGSSGLKKRCKHRGTDPPAGGELGKANYT
jgi:hypothetical protein